MRLFKYKFSFSVLITRMLCESRSESYRARAVERKLERRVEVRRGTWWASVLRSKTMPSWASQIKRWFGERHRKLWLFFRFRSRRISCAYFSQNRLFSFTEQIRTQKQNRTNKKSRITKKKQTTVAVLSSAETTTLTGRPLNSSADSSCCASGSRSAWYTYFMNAGEV